MTDYVLWFKDLGMHDVDRVGGKNASLGEMISHLSSAGVSVPNGFATTAEAFREFLSQSGLAEEINNALTQLNVDDVNTLAAEGKRIRQLVSDTPFPPALDKAIEDAYRQLIANNPDMAVAVRSSATAEDLPDASFAGQQESYLNVLGLESVKHHIREVFASLYNDRAIAYRVHQGFEHADVALSAGVQQMVRSENGSSGVMFSLDTESGFDGVVFLTSSYGLGEMVVQGAVNPDEFYVYKQGLAEGKKAILRRNLGSKAIKMVYSDDPAERVAIVDVDKEESQRFSLTDEEVE